MSIVMGLDQHRAQITADWLDTKTGEVKRSRVAPADRAGVRRFVERFRGQELEVALEATTGWRFVVEELRRIGASVHLAEPSEMDVLDLRARVRLRDTLCEQRCEWQQRIQATLYHHVCPQRRALMVTD